MRSLRAAYVCRDALRVQGFGMDPRNILDIPALYAAWQAPFVGQKVRPFLDRVQPDSLGKVLELGCGPGTNAPLFAETEYVGIDLSAEYVASARETYGREFLQGDASAFEIPPQAPFDAVFINSLLHHLSDDQVRGAMSRAASSLVPGGHLHLLDLVLPSEPSVARTLAQLDRGDHPRPVELWEDLVRTAFDVIHVQPYPVRGLGVPCWQMVYIEGVRRDD